MTNAAFDCIFCLSCFSWCIYSRNSRGALGDANPLQRCTLCLGKTPMIMHASHTSQISLDHTSSSWIFPQVLGLFHFNQRHPSWIVKVLSFTRTCVVPSTAFFLLWDTKEDILKSCTGPWPQRNTKAPLRPVHNKNEFECQCFYRSSSGKKIILKVIQILKIQFLQLYIYRYGYHHWNKHAVKVL